MANNLKELLNRPLPRGNATHATMLAVVGGYLMYMAWQMVQNTLSGNSTMSMTTTVILAAIMALLGLGAISYGIFMWYRGVKADKKNAGQSPEEEA